MPTYVYIAVDDGCEACREPFEARHRMSETLEQCAECEAELRKVITPVATSFPAGPAALRNMGMARLEKRADGNYENVSAQSGGQKVGSLDSFAKDLSSGDKPIISS